MLAVTKAKQYNSGMYFFEFFFLELAEMENSKKDDVDDVD